MEQGIPEARFSGRAALSADELAAFRKAGALVVRGLLGGEELAALRAETLPLVERAAAERLRDPDYQYKRHEETGREVPFRVEYVVDKLPACRALLGHPFVLRSVEALQGRDFVPTWDSMVWKLAGAGAAIEWHRDAGTDQCDPGLPIFNVDFYLDAADATNCLWAIPGSQRWDDAQAARECEERNRSGFDARARCRSRWLQATRCSTTSSSCTARRPPSRRCAACSTTSSAPPTWSGAAGRTRPSTCR